MGAIETPIRNRVREARLAAGLSQERLADRIGTTQNAVSRWERGAVKPSRRYLTAIADATGRPDLLDDGEGGEEPG